LIKVDHFSIKREEQPMPYPSLRKPEKDHLRESFRTLIGRGGLRSSFLKKLFALLSGPDPVYSKTAASISQPATNTSREIKTGISLNVSAPHPGLKAGRKEDSWVPLLSVRRPHRCHPEKGTVAVFRLKRE